MESATTSGTSGERARQREAELRIRIRIRKRKPRRPEFRVGRKVLCHLVQRRRESERALAKRSASARQLD